jgi:hypothetical protein
LIVNFVTDYTGSFLLVFVIVNFVTDYTGLFLLVFVRVNFVTDYTGLFLLVSKLTITKTSKNKPV